MARVRYMLNSTKNEFVRSFFWKNRRLERKNSTLSNLYLQILSTDYADSESWLLFEPFMI